MEKLTKTPCNECPLRLAACFKKAESKELEFIEHFKKEELSLNERESLYLEGDEVKLLYTIKSGWAFRYKTMPDGRRQILNFILPGDFIGLEAELNKPISHGVEILTSATLCAFPSARIMTLYRNFPGLGYDLTWLAAHEELIVDENLLSVGRRTAKERIAMLLVSLYKRAESIGLLKDKILYLPIKQHHIADALGLSLVHTNKTLAQLKKLGVHEWIGDNYSIKQIDKLQRLAEYYAIPIKHRPLI